MKQTIVILFFILALASCKERTGTAPAPIPPPAPTAQVTPPPMDTAQGMEPETDGVPYSFPILFAGGCGWYKLNKDSMRLLEKRIEKAIKLQGFCIVYDPDPWGRVTVGAVDTTGRKWSYNAMSKYCRSGFTKVRKLVEQYLPPCQELTFRCSSNHYRHLNKTITIAYDTINPTAGRKIMAKLRKEKRGFQAICNTLTRRCKTYDPVTVELFENTHARVKHGSAKFQIPINSQWGEVYASDSLYKKMIPGLIDKVKKIQPYFQQIKLVYQNYQGEELTTQDTLFISQ